jgi:hypothetical protein
MKNIHLIPTDKPSRLYKIENKLGLLEEPNRNFLAKNQHIYITSDEEIKDVRPHKGKWQLEQEQILNKFPTYLTDLSECKLVIMTTDQELIADGVQAIDDEFLEWFVKSPSCEEVKIEDYGTLYNFRYLILIPQEEPKCTCKEHDPYCCQVHGSCPTCVKQEEPKQETLEEAARRYTESATDNDAIRIFSFIAGAKSEAARDYWFEQFKKKGGDK